MENEKNALIAEGSVYSLSINGGPVEKIDFNIAGPTGDSHEGYVRSLSKHDGDYLATSGLRRGDPVMNCRSWTGLALDELRKIEYQLGLDIPQGCLLENLVFTGIEGFSRLPPTTRLVFPKHANSQLILMIFEENGPCAGVGKRLQDHYPQKPNLCTDFIHAAQGKRGVMGFVFSPGWVQVGETVQVFSPT